jgi:DNA-binding transcriptional ArsR family regulator
VKPELARRGDLPQRLSPFGVRAIRLTSGIISMFVELWKRHRLRAAGLVTVRRDGRSMICAA